MYTNVALASHPFATLYLNRAFRPGFKRSLFTIIAGVGACGILAYTIKKVHSTLQFLTRPHNELPIGLPNPRNLCYLNALLQAMAANANLVRFLQRSALIRRTKLLLCLVCLLKGLRCTSRYLATHRLDETLSHIHGELLRELTTIYCWATGEQQDAHELFNFFMDIACFRELGYTATKAASGLTSVSHFTGQRFETVVPNCQHRYRLADGVKSSLLIPQSPLRTEVFQRHLIATQVTCSRCDYRSSPVLQPESCITVFCDPSQEKLEKQFGCASASTLGACLQKQFCVSERLPDMYCPKCQSKTDSSSAGYCQRNQWIAHLPSCLVMHVQRSQWKHCSISPGFRTVYNKTIGSIAAGNGIKCAEHLVFPYKLDMNRYISKGPIRKDLPSGDYLPSDNEIEVRNSAPPKLYILRAILVHQGNSINSGHYVTYRAWRKQDLASQSRREKSFAHFLRTMIISISNFFQGLPCPSTKAVSSPWILTSDSWVTSVPVEDVRDCTAYLLFYERTTSYNLITGCTSCRKAQHYSVSNADCPAEYADWEQADTCSIPCLQPTIQNMEENDEDLDDADDYDDTDVSDEVNYNSDFLLTTGTRADVIKSLALAISQM